MIVIAIAPTTTSTPADQAIHRHPPCGVPGPRSASSIPVSYICMTSSQRRAAADPTDSAVRERLIAATSRSITARGTVATTSRVIADAAGENLAAITYYFGSKDNLIVEALARNARELIQPVITTLTDPEASPAEKLIRSVQMLNSILVDSRERIPGYLQCIAAATHDDTIATKVRALQDELITVLTDEMSKQVDDGLIPPWVRPEVMAQLIVALANGVAVAAAIDPARTDGAAIGEQFARLLLGAAPVRSPPSAR